MSKKEEAYGSPPSYTSVPQSQPAYPQQQYPPQGYPPAYQTEPTRVVGCRLISTEGHHLPLDLHDQVPLIVGRQKKFKIKDVNCSKEQVEIRADFRNECATVKRLGSNASKIDSHIIDKNSEAVLKMGQILYLTLDRLPYKIEFSFDKTCKRKASENGKGSHSKRVKTDDVQNENSENDSDNEIDEKLKMMRENFSKVPETSPDLPRPAIKDSGEMKSIKSGWSEYNDCLMIYRSEGLKHSSKIAGFDMDGTIITTKSGRVFPTGPDDWQILYAEIPKKLKELTQDGFKVVFFTNQLGISRGKMTKSEFHRKVEAILKRLGCPVHVQAGIKPGFYRKPCIGSWKYFVQHENGGLSVDMNQSFYCGDAAGRPENKNKKKKKDFSCSDRLFAMNVGLKFLTPEEFFLKEKPGPFNLPDFDPQSLFKDAVKLENFVSDKQEVIVNCGFPASGKSHFSKEFLVPKGYVYVSRDELGAWQKCVARCEEALKNDKSVVIDNTNPDVESRSRYVAVAKSRGVRSRCFYFPASVTQCRHNEAYREMTDSKHAKIPDMLMNSCQKKFKIPETSEGFCEIVKVPFLPSFKNKEDENLYKLFLLEK